LGTGTLELEVVDDNEVLGHTYTLTFDDTTSDELTFSVYDETEGKSRVMKSSNITAESSGDDPVAFPYFDGVGLKIVNHDAIELLDAEWTYIQGDTSNYSINVIPPAGDFPYDYEIRWLGGDADTVDLPGATKTVPFQVWNISFEPPQKADLFVIPPAGDFRSGEDQVKLWEVLDPANPNIKTFTWIFTVDFDSLMLEDSTMVARTAPTDGDIFTFTCKKTFTSDDSFRFQTYAVSSAVTESVLDQIRVVPNPYVVTHAGELNTNNSQLVIRNIRFTHVPPKCTIDIYTISGDHIRTLRHDNPTYGEVHWDVLTKETLDVSYGIYIYVVKTEDQNGDEIKKVGKLAIVK
jgi:hypothetical protein